MSLMRSRQVSALRRSGGDDGADGVVGKLKPQGMITRKITMEEVEEKGFKTLVNDKDNHVKILVEVSPPK